MPLRVFYHAEYQSNHYESTDEVERSEIYLPPDLRLLCTYGWHQQHAAMEDSCDDDEECEPENLHDKSGEDDALSDGCACIFRVSDVFRDETAA
jgi:hypothetical protein